jgi:PAS domain S-box-containing protein
MSNHTEVPLEAPRSPVPPPYLRRNLHLFTRLSSFLVMGMGVLGIAGAVLHIPLFRSLLVGRVTMKANTALCLIVIGLALRLLDAKEPLGGQRRLLAQALSLLVAIIGFLSFGESLYGWDLGIDQLLFSETAIEAVGSIRPGLMSPLTAVDLVLLGLALMLLDWRPRTFWPSQVLAWLGGLVGLFAMFDFVLVTGAGHTGVAFPTSIALLLLSVAVVCSRHDRGLAALLASPGLGGTMIRGLLPASILVPAVIAFMRWKGYQQGLYSEWFGVTLMSVTAIALLAGMTTWTGFVIERADAGRKKATEDLRMSEQRYRSLVVATAQVVWTTNADGQVVGDMPMWRAFTGMTLQEIQGRGWINSLHPEDRERTAAIWKQAVHTRSLYQAEYRLRRQDGEFRHVTVRGVPVLDSDGGIREWVGTCTDITTHKAAEDELRGQAALLNLAHDAIFVRDLDSRISFWSRGATETYGWSGQEAKGQVSHELLHTTFSIPRPGIEALLQQKGEWDGELTHVKKDGSAIVVASRWSLQRDTNGNPRAILEINRDITERKYAEEQLRRASLYARSLLEASLDPLVTISKEGRIMDVNRAAELVTAAAREHLIGSDFCEYFTEPENARRGYEQAFATGSVRDYPLAIRRPGGQVTEVLYNATVFKNEAGEVEGVFAAARDMTELKRAEHAVQAERQRFRDVLDKLPTYVVLLTPDYHAAFANRVFRERFGEAKHGERCFELLFSRSEPCEICETYKVLRAKTPLQWKWTGPDGRNYDVFDFPFTDSDGSALILEMGLDVTDQQRAEQEIRKLNDELEQRVKLRTAELEGSNKELEAFTYSVSHDLRAPLRHISGFSKILLEEYGAQIPEEAQHYLERMAEGTRRMGNLVDDLLNLARVGRYELRTQMTGLNSIVEEVRSELMAECEGRQIEWKIGTLPFVECDPSLIKQVFQNLISNALKFSRPRTPAVIEIGQALEHGHTTVFVRDNGVGFSMKYADKLFGVFQRLHRSEDFEGTGVGLATVQRIIRKHGGTIWAEAELDKGATFYFTIPASEAVAERNQMVMAGE